MSDDFEVINAALRAAVDDDTVLGVAAMGATSHGLVYEGFFGNANTQARTPMARDTVFWLLSMTKTFTAVACMQLIEQGKLDPEQSAADILPQLASPRVLDGFDAQGAPILRPAKGPIRVRHLLTHTSGYTYPNWSAMLTRYEQVTGLPNVANLQNGAFEAPLEFDPGDRWEYGISIDWIGKIIEEITGLSLEVYFRENIFEPLGMKDSGFLIGTDQRRRVATMAARQADGSLEPEEFEISQRPEFFSGGGGAYSTPQDYLRILQVLLNEGTLEGVQILRPDTVVQIRTNQIGGLDVHEMRTVVPAWSNNFDQFPGQRHKWGFSFDINERPGPYGRAAGSISWSGLLNCHWWVDPVKKVTGALFTQVRPFYDDRIMSLFGEFESGLYRGLEHS
ncbi:MAG TPA: serine hydrolase domain-containing protein [Solirubrobacteraceae bacterium]|jgi:CubicO group peptidase (beta-lactamase class C family)